MPRALIVCPGRGSYGRDTLGWLRDRGPAAAAVIAACDAWRDARGRPTVSALDADPVFRVDRHLAGEHASLLTFACSLADLADLDPSHEVVGVTGNSMGWYTALAASGALPLDEAIRLVDTMGAWQEDHVVGGQLLVPLTGEDWQFDPARLAAVEAALERAAQAGTVAWSVRLGSHAVLAGDDPGLDALVEALPREPRGGRTFPLRLPRQSAFHTPLLAETARRAHTSLSDLAFRAPRVPLIDGHGVIHRPRWADPVALRDHTLGAQVVEVYDFALALRVALHHVAPDVVVVLGPGDSLGGPIAATLVNHGWWGLRSRGAFEARQATQPVLLSFGRADQRARLRGG